MTFREKKKEIFEMEIFWKSFSQNGPKNHDFTADNIEFVKYQHEK